MRIKLVVDTREQLPLTFHSTENYKVVTEKLDFGDYGLEIDGKLVCVFERKNPSDLAGSIMAGHKRLVNETNRAKADNFQLAIAAECSYSDFINKKFDGGYMIRKPGYVLAKIIHTMQLHHNIQFLFFNGRDEMRDYIRNTFNAIITEHIKKNINKEYDREN